VDQAVLLEKINNLELNYSLTTRLNLFEILEQTSLLKKTFILEFSRPGYYR
jgi:hypothetical protein